MTPRRKEQVDVFANVILLFVRGEKKLTFDNLSQQKEISVCFKCIGIVPSFTEISSKPNYCINTPDIRKIEVSPLYTPH